MAKIKQSLLALSQYLTFYSEYLNDKFHLFQRKKIIGINCAEATKANIEEVNLENI